VVVIGGMICEQAGNNQVDFVNLEGQTISSLKIENLNRENYISVKDTRDTDRILILGGKHDNCLVRNI
jgi:hypothetical protein